VGKGFGKPSQGDCKTTSAILSALHWEESSLLQVVHEAAASAGRLVGR